MKTRLLPMLAAAVALGLTGQPSRAGGTRDDSGAVVIGGSVSEFEQITARPSTVDLLPIIDPGLQMTPYLSGTSDLKVGVNTPLTVALTADQSMTLRNIADNAQTMTCAVVVSVPASLPSGSSYVRSYAPTGTQTVFMKGLVGSECYPLGLMFLVAPQDWTIIRAGGKYSGTTTLTIAPANWPGGTTR